MIASGHTNIQKMLRVLLVAFLAPIVMATSDASRKKTFNVIRLDSTVTTHQYPWQQASECIYDQRLNVLTCMGNYPYENVTTVWKQTPENILYVSVNCLTRGQRRGNTCMCKKSASSSQKPSEPELYSLCQLTNLDEGILRRLVNLEVLDLSFNLIETVSKRSFTALKKLKYLSLSKNNIKEIPSGFLCQVINLEYLGLSELALKSYPDKIFRCKNNFTSLKVMDIRGGKFTEIPDDALDQLPSLQSLDLSFTPITQIKKKAFSGGKLLEFLDFSNCNISSIFPYFCDFLPHISRLYLHDNNFTTFDFTTLEKCLSLTHVDLSSNTIRTLNGNISHLSAVTAINLGFNDIISLNKTFKGLENLTALILSHNNMEKLQNDSLAGLKNLVILDLSGNNISDSTNFETVFNDLESLRLLDLSFNNIEIIPDKGLKRLQKLKHLLFNHNSIVELRKSSFHGLDSLNLLSLDNNRLQELPDDIFLPFVPRGDKNGTAFSHLTLSYNNFSDISNVKKWPLTEYLDISNNDLASVPSAIDYSNMKTLNVSHNKLVSFFGKQENLAADFENMKEVDISFNAIADIDTARLQTMTNVEYINAESNKLNFDLTDNTFKGMKNLIRLNLANNNIQTIDNPFTVGSFQNLTLLNISSNPIHKLGTLSQGYYGSRLETVEMTLCSLTTIGTNTFRGLLSLKYVDLRKNLIKTFPPFLANVSTKYNLINNPVVCACNMSWLKERYVNFTKEDKKILVSNYKVPKCQVYTEETVYYPHYLSRRQFMCPEVKDCDSECACFKTEQNGSITTIECQNGLQTVPKLSSAALSIFLDGNSFNETSSLSEFLLFTNMSAKELYLNKSYISYLETKYFSAFDRLEILNLAFNLLTLLPSGVFKSQTMLKHLYLNDNSLQTIQVNVFDHLYSLQELDISGNKLVFLSSTTATELSDLDYMKYFFLARNKWACDCSNLGFKDLVDEVLPKIRDRKLLVCGKDNSKEIRYLPRSEFLCSGEDNTNSSKKTLIVVIIVVTCVLLLLLALFIYFRRELLSMLYYTTGCHIPGKTRYAGVHFDAYLTFDPSDQHCASYVHNTLMPKLKNNSYNIQTSSDVIEDLEVTRKVIEDSRCSIFIVDKNFATNSFLVNAFLLATARQRVEKRHKVILVIHGDIDLLTLEPELVSRMRKGDYITARSRLWWQRLVYELPEPSCGFRHGLDSEEEDVVVFSSLAEDQSKYVQF
ncbi:toll-like receptor 6 isoform X2 [Mercenaria mercenaria]|nr:toll-like receptor 6 isoform X2 [Mercenaria mercenaria]